jgi:hypothetical protein
MQQWYQCPRCGATVPFGERFCGNCGTQLNWPAQQQPQPPPQSQQQSGGRWAYQQQAGYGQQMEKQGKKKSPWLIVGLGMMTLVLIGGIAFAVGMTSQDTAPSTPPSTSQPSPPSGTLPPATFALSTSVNPSGAGAISPSSGQYQQGEQISVMASPSSGYTFSHWSGDVSGSSPTITITMDSDKVVVAHFELKESYQHHDYYPIILSLSDDKGNVIKTSLNNHYVGPYASSSAKTSLKIGDKISWTIAAEDPKNRQLSYRWHSNSQRFNQLVGYKWGTSNQLAYEIAAEDLQTAGEYIRIVGEIKSEKEYLRSPGSEHDDAAFLDYKLLP